MSGETRLTGGCLCGAIRYEAEGPACNASICHCHSCRRAAAAPAVAWFTVERDALRFTAGEPTGFRSSPHVVRSFCGTCGTPLTYTSEAFPTEIDVTLCSLDNPDNLPPVDHTHVAEKLRWTVLCDDLPAYPAARPT